MYSFRIAFNLPSGLHLGFDATRVEIAPAVVLQAGGSELPICRSSRVALIGSNFTSLDDANAEGARWLDATKAAMARIGMGVDLGEQSPAVYVTEAGLEAYGASQGRRYLQDNDGLTVFKTEPPAGFLRVQAEAIHTSDPVRTLSVLKAAYQLGPHHDYREGLAFDLFSASFFSPVVEARLMLLMMAVETLIVPDARSPESVRHVQLLIEQTGSAKIPAKEKAGIMTALSYQKQDSISVSGQKLAETMLAGRTYLGIGPADFFRKCYGIRSALAHGAVPRPDRREVHDATFALSSFVSHLLAPKLP